MPPVNGYNLFVNTVASCVPAAVMAAARDTNKFLTDEAPWLIKGDGADAVARRQEVRLFSYSLPSLHTLRAHALKRMSQKALVCIYYPACCTPTHTTS